jgi:hypothetical protein
MSCMYFLRQSRPPDDSTESSDSIAYWRKLLARFTRNDVLRSTGIQSFGVRRTAYGMRGGEGHKWRQRILQTAKERRTRQWRVRSDANAGEASEQAPLVPLTPSHAPDERLGPARRIEAT